MSVDVILRSIGSFGVEDKQLSGMTHYNEKEEVVSRVKGFKANPD